MENKLQQLHQKLCSLAVFRGVLETPVFSLFGGYCYCEGEDFASRLNAYAAFVAEIYANGGDLTKLVQKIVFADENVYVKGYAKGEKINPHILASVERELSYFTQFASLTPQDFAKDLGLDIKEACELAAKYGLGAKQSSGNIDDGEIAVFLNKLTLENQFAGIDSYFNGEATIKSQKKKAKVEKKEEAKVEEKVEAKIETKVEAKVEEKAEKKAEKPVEKKVEVKAEAKAEVKAEPKAEKPAQKKPEFNKEPQKKPEFNKDFKQ